MKRRHVILFQPRFARLVESGVKHQTIRPRRMREIRDGDILDLREWLGAPYRSKQRLILQAACAGIQRCEINSQGVVLLDGERAPKGFARRDGFHSHCQMVAWFAAQHGLPFHGQLIRWSCP